MSLVGAVHTTRLVIDSVHQSLLESGTNLQISHVLDEGILRKLAALGQITPEIVAWLTDMVASTQAIGADLAVVSCSSLSPCVDQVSQQVGIPVLKIDQPMMEYAVQNGNRIGLVMTNPTTEKPSQLLFSATAERLNSKATLLPKLCPDAFAKLTGGDIAGHDRQVVTVIREMLTEVDLVMLAQISIAHVRNHLSDAESSRVLSSLDFIGDKVNELLHS